jgi:hypothetical protein
VRQTIADVLYNTDADETPVLALIKKGEKPNGMTATWQGEKISPNATTGVVDNTPATSPTSRPRRLITAYCQHFRKEWGVGYLATLSNVAGIGRNEAGKQLAAAMVEHRIMVEARMLGIDEMQAESSPTPYEMRGMFMWLSAAAQAVNAVHADLRPTSSQNLTTAMASVTETIIKAAIQACFTQRGGIVDLLGVVGGDLRQVIDDFTNVYPAASSSTQPRTMYALNDPRTYQNTVDMIKTSFGRVSLMTSPRLVVDETTGEATAYSPKSGIFIDRKMWELCWLDAPANTNLAADGSGKKGFVDGVGIVKCLNPRGQFRLYSNS